MRNIPIKNSHFLKQIQKFEKFTGEEYLRYFEPSCRSHGKKEQEHFTSIKYLKTIIKEKKNHDGFPASLKAYSLQHSTFRLNEELANHPVIPKILDDVHEIITDLELEYNLKNNALLAIYPPGGYIAWHNNANAAAYNLILTWSENGSGQFNYLDKRKNKIIQMNDSPGWQCKLGYFGAYNDPEEELVYHCAKTDCWRITVSFVFDRSEISKHMQNWIIEDIMRDQ